MSKPELDKNDDKEWTAKDVRLYFSSPDAPSRPLMRTAFGFKDGELRDAEIKTFQACKYILGDDCKRLPNHSAGDSRVKIEQRIRSEYGDVFERPRLQLGHEQQAHWLDDEILNDGLFRENNKVKLPSIYQAWIRMVWSVMTKKHGNEVKKEEGMTTSTPTKHSKSRDVSVARSEASFTRGIAEGVKDVFMASPGKAPGPRDLGRGHATELMAKPSISNCLLSLGIVKRDGSVYTITQAAVPVRSYLKSETATFLWDDLSRDLELPVGEQMKLFCFDQNSGVISLRRLTASAALLKAYNSASTASLVGNTVHLPFFVADEKGTVQAIPPQYRQPHLYPEEEITFDPQFPNRVGETWSR